MTVFGDYALYYNLLYADKAYAQEADFVLQCLSRAGCSPQTVLDLGCGTGRHALEMARRGLRVTGVDMSETMLAMGRAALEACTDVRAELLPVLHRGDVRTLRLGQTFDAVTSLFHVMSYQISEDDALALLVTAREHLKDGGVLLFDFWHGPGVLTEPPSPRQRVLQDAQTHIERRARPVHRVAENRVDVQYEIALTDKASGARTQLEEVHPMRYWFMPEVRYLARQAGFRVVADGAWMQARAAGVEDWSAWALLQK